MCGQNGNIAGGGHSQHEVGEIHQPLVWQEHLVVGEGLQVAGQSGPPDSLNAHQVELVDVESRPRAVRYQLDGHEGVE